jgi:hypothetical protein
VRFVFAIVTFVVAAALIGLGFAQRTIWAPQANVVAETHISGGAAYTVIPGTVLNANPGQQTLHVAGSDKAFVAYGRTDDVLAWIGDQRYARVSYSAGGKMTSKVVKGTSSDNGGTSATTPGPTGSTAPAPGATGATSGTSTDTTSTDTAAGSANPVGSDLWLEQFAGADAATTRMNVPDSVSVIIASDGTEPAPQDISVVWPLDTRTPWSGPLIVGGGALLIVGLVLYLFALRHMRRSRGPRRSSGIGGGPKMPKPPKPVSYKPTKAMESGGRGRRSIGRSLVAVPVLLSGALILTGCSSDYWPTLGSGGKPTATATPLATDLPGQGKDTPPPAVTGPQLAQIVGRISSVATEADAKLDKKLIDTRFAGPALQERVTSYTIRAKDAKALGPQAIPSGPVVVGLPQATDTWPRVVSAVVQDAKNTKAAPIDIVMVQNSPRENYVVQYAVVLQAKAKVPDLPPTNIGASLVPPNSQLLMIEPDKLASAYADVLTKGTKSQYYGQFDVTSDELRKQVGAMNAAAQNAQFNKDTQKAAFSFAEQAGIGDPIALATNKSGAVVATSLNEVNTVKPTAAGAKVTVKADSAASALTGVTSTGKGLQTTYGMQLLFYVPPADSHEQIRLLGFTVSVVGAKDLAK